MTVHHAQKHTIGRSEPSPLACSSPLPSSCLVSHLRHSHRRVIRLPHTCNLHVRSETNGRRVGHSAVRKTMNGDVFLSPSYNWCSRFAQCLSANPPHTKTRKWLQVHFLKATTTHKTRTQSLGLCSLFRYTAITNGVIGQYILLSA